MRINTKCANARDEVLEGIRVTPNVYTTLDEIDRFVEAMQGILRADASSRRPAG